MIFVKRDRPARWISEKFDRPGDLHLHLKIARPRRTSTARSESRRRQSAGAPVVLPCRAWRTTLAPPDGSGE
jgi:hypothetical protein